jgi:signal transduction histidine kinase
MSPQKTSVGILLVAECEERATLLRAQLAMLLPSAAVTPADSAAIAEGQIPSADAALIDGGAAPRATADLLRALRARRFDRPIVVITPAADDTLLLATMASMGAVHIERAVADRSPPALAGTLLTTMGENAAISAELRQARRVFAAGQLALSLQHAINNPLAALMAEAQLLQMEQLSADQRGSVDRMIELCRRIVALVRRLDALAEG